MIGTSAAAGKRRAAERIGLFVPVIGRRLFAFLVPIDHDGAQLLFARGRWSARPGQIWLTDGHSFRALIYARAARALFTPRLIASAAIPTFFGNDLQVYSSLSTRAMLMASRVFISVTARFRPRASADRKRSPSRLTTGRSTPDAPSLSRPDANHRQPLPNNFVLRSLYHPTVLFQPSLLRFDASKDLLLYQTGNTALHEAAARGDKDAVRGLLSDNANLYIRNKSGATALHLACQFGRTTCIRLLLEAGCRTNVTDTYDDTPLHTAVRYLHVGASKTLLVYNANPNERNKNDDTALHLSCNLGHRKLSKMLLQAGASRQMINCQGETPMDIAARKQCDELVTLLRTAPSSSHNKDSIKRWGKDRRNQIRMKLQAAREAGSNWHLLFQDFDPTTQAGLSLNNSKVGLPILRKGEQYFIDLAGKVHKLIKQNTTAHQELLDEIDACHDELSHEISDLRQVTERKLADLHRDLRHYRPKHRRQTREDSSSPAAGLLIRSKSESEIEPDHLSPDGQSNASDDIYIERYFRPRPKQSMNKSAANRDKQSTTGSRLSSSDNQTTSSHLSKIQAACQETMRQFNCLDLDDTCTTPTSASSHRTSRSSHRRLTGDSFSLASTADKHTEAVYAADTSHRASIYSSRSGGDAGPQPPSLDSGYGTGFSPSPARPSPAGDAWTESASLRLNEIGTQTYEVDANEYTELESAVVVRASVAVKRPLPRLPIPPPPTKPLPPLPKSQPPTTSSRKTKSAHTRAYCVSTNV